MSAAGDRIRDVETVRGGSPDKPRNVNLFESPRFFADVHVLRPGQSQAAHVHGAQDKCLFVLSGRGVVLARGEETPVGPGHVVWSPAGEEHGVRCDGSEDLRLLVFMAPHPRFTGASDGPAPTLARSPPASGTTDVGPGLTPLV